MEKNLLSVRTGRSLSRDEKEAVSEFHRAVEQPDCDAVVFFCSSRYNLERLGMELARHFHCPLMGCTTAGEISHYGYQDGGIVGASLSSKHLRIHRRVISPLSRFSLQEAAVVASNVRTNLSIAKGFEKQHMFGLILIDGLSMREEAAITSLYTCFEGIPIIGGSAGDDLELKRTYIYDEGQFKSDAAVFTVFETQLPFLTFKTQHFQPTEWKVVVTEADSTRRVITELNGQPAAMEYARILGLVPDQLTPTVFSRAPLLLRIGGEWHVRSIQKSNADNSLSMFSAIEEGLVLTIGKGVDIVNNFKEQMAEIEKAIPQNRFFLLCDCILRKLEL
ncbi:MAG: FIST C-terminal domain-containing protein, partial [Deltaproteobacteria bacterium]|nr:FIST C-terminal domain-containing protein [Deltaproteobacteria bacterium]